MSPAHPAPRHTTHPDGEHSKQDAATDDWQELHLLLLLLLLLLEEHVQQRL
jgi:hypothetical protein